MKPGWPSLHDIGAEELFEKVLTTSDANAQGRVIIPKAHAINHFPSLDKGAEEIPCQDTYGNWYTFKFHAWTNSQSKMFLLEGTQDIQAAYGLVAGDSLVFGRLPTGELVAAGKIRAEGALPLTQAAPQKIVVNLDRSRRRRRTQVPYDPSDPGASHGGAERASTAEMPEEDPLQKHMDRLVDGIFRAVPDSHPQGGTVVKKEHGNWVLAVSLRGETYKAYFEDPHAAQEALQAIDCS